MFVISLSFQYYIFLIINTFRADFGELSVQATWNVYDPRHNKPLYMLLRCQYLTLQSIKKKFPFYRQNCKWLKRKIQRGAYTTHRARNVLKSKS